jgi:hypothetical protein
LTQPGDGIARINFGSPVSNRFVSVSAVYEATFNSTNNSGANYRRYDATSIEVFTFASGNSADTHTRPVTIILY